MKVTSWVFDLSWGTVKVGGCNEWELHRPLDDKRVQRYCRRRYESRRDAQLNKGRGNTAWRALEASTVRV